VNNCVYLQLPKENQFPGFSLMSCSIVLSFYSGVRLYSPSCCATAADSFVVHYQINTD